MAEETREYVPIYYDSPEKAYRESVTSPEADAFRASFRATERCTGDIQAALGQYRESTGKFSSTDFIEGLIDKHGKDRVEYVLASYIRSHENETAYFSDEVKSWARGIRISESYMIANTILIAGGDDMVNALGEEMRQRDLAAEYIAAKEGDSPEETDTQAETPEPTVNEDVTKNEDGSVTVRMPGEAVIRRYQTSAVLCMPRNRGYDMYRYMVDIRAYRENGDGTVDVTLGTTDTHTLTIRRRGQEQKLNSDKLYEVFAGATKEDYMPQKYTVEVPTDAVQGNYPNMIRCKFPDSSRYTGQHAVIPTIFKDETKSNDEKVVFSIPDYINFSVRGDDGEDKLIPVSELASEVNGGTYRKRVRWSQAVLPSEALLHVYDRHTLLKMPENGMYEGFVYYLPNGMAPLDKDGSIMVRIPEDRKIEIKNGMTGEKEELTVLEWSRIVTGKTSMDYTVKREVPEEERKFLETAEKIRSALPPEMLAEASWIPVMVTESKLDAPEDRLRPGKVAVAPDKRFSGYEAGYKNIGTDFDKAVRAGRYEGATLMGYCFTKDSDVACIELDKCLNKDGTPKTEKAKEILEKLDGTYTERSYSGEGLHIFGKLSDPEIETLSKDGDAEIFAGCGYIALTGDVVKSPKTLAPLDEGYMKKFIEENFGERKETPKPTEEDKKILDKMFGGSQGEDFKALYNGENVRGGKELCDASLAMRLSSVSGCDTAAVLRLYNASKREDKDPELVTHIVKRAADKVTDMLSDMKKPPREDVSVRMEKLRKEREEREKFERRMKKYEGPTM